MAYFKGRLRTVAFALLLLGGLVAFFGRPADGQIVNPYAYPKAPPGTTLGYVPQVANTSGAATWGPVAVDAGAISPGTSTQIFQTNATPAAGWVTVTGDTTINASGVTTTGKINGATVPAAGSLTTGNVLQVSGASALTYGLLPLSGMTPGLNGQVLWTASSGAAFWATTPARHAVANDGADPTGSADSSNAIHNCLVNAASSNQCCWLPPGTYKVANPIVMPSGICLTARTGVVLNSTMTGTGTEIHNPFQTTNPTATGTTTLSAAVTLESSSITVASATGISAGTNLRLRSLADGNNHWLYYVVASSYVSGTTIPLDRPVMFPFSSGDDVDIVPSRNQDIYLDLLGVVIQGTGDTAIQFWGVGRGWIHGPIINGTFSNWGTTVDLGSDHVFVQDEVIKGSSNGFASSSSELALFQHIDVQGSVNDGFDIWDGIDVDLVDSRANNSATRGAYFSTNGNTHGNIRLHVNGLNVDKNPTGLVVDSNAVGTVLRNVSAQNDSFAGIVLNGVPADVQSSVVSSGIAGSGSTYTCSGIGAGYGGLIAEAGSKLRASGITITGPGGAAGGTTQYGIMALGSGTTVDLSDVDLDVDSIATGALFVGVAACNDAVSGGSTVRLRSMTFRGASIGSGSLFGVGVESASTMLLGPGVDLSPITSANRSFGPGSFMSETASGGAFVFNQGTVGATGTSGAVQLANNGAVAGSIQAWTTSPTQYSAIYLGPNITPGGSNWYGLSDGSSTSYVNGFSTGVLYAGGGNILQWTTTGIAPGSFGGYQNGTSALPWGAAYFGASSTSGTGYTVFAAHGGTKDTQDAIDQWSCFDVNTINSSFGPVNAQTYLIAAHHGMRVECHATGRIVTAGVGGTFWTATADHTYSCTQAASEGWTGSTSFGNNAWYGQCDCSGGICTSASAPTNPLITFTANVTGSGTGTLQVAYTLFNDGSTTKPVVDILSCCRVEDN